MKLGSLLLTLLLIAALAGIGYASITASKYSDVSSLASLTAPQRVTIQGENVPLEPGEYKMTLGDKIFIVESRGPYAIATEPKSGESYALFILRGSDGSLAAALYPARDFVAKYGGSPIVEDTIVVDAVYRPGKSIVIYSGSTPLLQAGVLEVQSILKGCHASYEQQQANTR